MENRLRPTLAHEAFVTLQSTSASSTGHTGQTPNSSPLDSCLVHSDSTIMLVESLYTAADLEVILLMPGGFKLIITDTNSLLKFVPELHFIKFVDFTFLKV